MVRHARARFTCSGVRPKTRRPFAADSGLIAQSWPKHRGPRVAAAPVGRPDCVRGPTAPSHGIPANPASTGQPGPAPFARGGASSSRTVGRLQAEARRARAKIVGSERSAGCSFSLLEDGCRGIRLRRSVEVLLRSMFKETRRAHRSGPKESAKEGFGRHLADCVPGRGLLVVFHSSFVSSRGPPAQNAAGRSPGFTLMKIGSAGSLKQAVK